MKYAIIFFDKSILWVDQQKANAIDDLIRNRKSQPFDIDGNLYITSSIAKILSEQEYKEQYPDKQEQGQIFRNNFPQLADKIDYQYESIDEQAIRATNGRQQLIADLQRYIDENPNRCENAKQLLKEKKIKFGLV